MALFSLQLSYIYFKVFVFLSKGVEAYVETYIFCKIQLVLLFHWLPCALNQISPSILLTATNCLLDEVSFETQHLNEFGDEYDTNEENLNSVPFIE